MNNHERFMQEALALAARAEGQTSPNPLVGAIVVKSGKIVGRGWHRYAGAAHAEAVALREAGEAAKGAVLYVTLEPCAHRGRTPPCCDAVIESGIRRVIVAVRDPNPQVAGRGIRRLKREGLDVEVGCCRLQAKALNRPYFKALQTGLPFIIAKAGQSLDGKIATGSGASKWITSAGSRKAVHQLRRRCDAILTGVETVIRDNPELTVRGVRQRRNPLVRVIMDSRLRIPVKSRCLTGVAPTFIATLNARGPKARQLRKMGMTLIETPARRGRVSMPHVLRALCDEGMQRVLIEGGGEILGSAFDERLVDALEWFIAPKIIGGRDAFGTVAGQGIRELKQAVRLENIRVSATGEDLHVEADVAYPS